MAGMNIGDATKELEKYADESTGGGLTEQGRKDLETATYYLLEIEKLIGKDMQDLPGDVANAIGKFNNCDKDAHFLSNVVMNWYEQLDKKPAPSKKRDKSAGNTSSSGAPTSGISNSKNLAIGDGAKATDKSKNLIINKLDLPEDQYALLVSKLEERLGKELKTLGSDVNKTIVQTLADRKMLDYLGDIACERLKTSQKNNIEEIKNASEKIVAIVEKNLSEIAKETRDELKGLLEWTGSIEESIKAFIGGHETRIAEKIDSIIINLDKIKEHLVGQNNFSKELAQGKVCLRNADFKGAKDFFDKVTNHKDNHNKADIADAYFYSALAEWQVQLVWDNRKSCYQPICYDYIIDIDNENGAGGSAYYNLALEYCEDKQLIKAYEEIVERIKNILKKFNELEEFSLEEGTNHKEKPNLEYDCFICFKKTDENGKDTDDYKWIQESKLVSKLKSEEINVNAFFSQDTLDELKKAGIKTDYEATVYYALSKAKCLLLVCSKNEYLQTPWVKNEYTRFCAKLKKENIPNSVIIVYKDEMCRLPGELKRVESYQQIDRNKSCWNVDEIANYVKNSVENAKGYLDENRKYCLNCRNGKGHFTPYCPTCGKKLVPFSVYTNEERRRTEEELKRAREEAERWRAEKEELEKRVKASTLATEDNQKQDIPKQQEVIKTSANVSPQPRDDAKISTATVKNTINLQDILEYGAKVITDGQFEDREDLIDVIIPNTVIKIESNAFRNCKNLTSITIPDSVTSIGNKAFEDCTGLRNITIPDSVTSIGADAFNGTAWYNNQPNGLVYAGKVAYKYKGTMPSNTWITIKEGTKGIGDYAFLYCTDLTSITIPDSVTSIGSRAFCGDSRLTSITIPDSVTSIGPGAFNGTAWYKYQPNGLVYAGKVVYKYKGNMPQNTAIVLKKGTVSIASSALVGCKKLASISIPDSVTCIGDSALAECTGLTSITIPDSVTNIGNSAFSKCAGLTSITIGNGVTNIGDFAFLYCTGLTSITIGNSVTNIGDFAFVDCSGLTSITIPNSVTSIGEHAFQNCAGLASITIPDSVEDIGDGAFSKCAGLTNITIGNGVTNMGHYAFGGCSSLTSATIPDGITIDKSVFDGCVGLKITRKQKQVKQSTQEAEDVEFSFDDVEESDEESQTTVPSYTDSNQQGIVPYGTNIITYGQFANREDLINVIIPNTVIKIERNAFRNCKNLTSITIGDGVTSIGGSVFSHCTSLKSITIPDSVTSIGEYAFAGCTGLTSITIPDSVTSIGSRAFYYCSSLTSATIPDGITIDKSVFDGCKGLKITRKQKQVKQSTQEAEDVEFSFDDVEESDEESQTTVPSYTDSDQQGIVPYGTNIITDGQFANREDLIDVIIPNTVIKIESNAFRNCKNLTSITIPNGVTSIGWRAFEGCKGLTSVTIPNSVTSIGGYAFSGCSKLTSITIPNSVTSIGADAFEDCINLTSVTIPNSVTNIDGYAFSGCGRLTSITIPNSVTNIDGYAFYGCSKLTSITIPNSVTNIDGYAFYGCSKLTSITIPDSVTSIGEYAFYGCSGLTSIPDSVTSIGEGAFDETAWYDNQPNGIIYIGKVAYGYKGDMTTNTKIALKGGTIGIAGGAFWGCGGLTSITLPNSVENIGGFAFADCTGLTSITIPDSVTNIGKSAFDGCDELKNIFIRDSVTQVGRDAFDGTAWYDNQPNGIIYIGKVAYKYKGDMPSNTTIVVKDGTVAIADCAFEGCGGLTSITIPGSLTRIGWNAFGACDNLTSITIREGATCICPEAFQYCSSVKSITIPDSVTSIGYSAFSGCTGLTSITIPNSVTNIGIWAFADCTSLTSVTIGNGVTSIGAQAFGGCSRLTSITIPDSVVSISGNAFCETAWYNNQPDGLVYAGKVAYKYKGTMPANTSIIITDGTKGIGNLAFYECTDLASITIPDSVTNIGKSAFYGCSKLTSITIPDSVTSIGEEAFWGCSKLTSVTIPDGITINESVFGGCKGLKITRRPKQAESKSNSAEQKDDEATRMALLLEQFNRILSEG